MNFLVYDNKKMKDLKREERNVKKDEVEHINITRNDA